MQPSITKLHLCHWYVASPYQRDSLYILNLAIHTLLTPPAILCTLQLAVFTSASMSYDVLNVTTTDNVVVELHSLQMCHTTMYFQNIWNPRSWFVYNFVTLQSR